MLEAIKNWRRRLGSQECNDDVIALHHTAPSTTSTCNRSWAWEALVTRLDLSLAEPDSHTKRVLWLAAARYLGWWCVYYGLVYHVQVHWYIAYKLLLHRRIQIIFIHFVLCHAGRQTVFSTITTSPISLSAL